MRFLQNKQTRALILVMIALVLVGLGIASVYYGNKNKWTDPRVSHAREMYEQYSDLVTREDYSGIMLLMDSIAGIYEAIPHYRNSYEQGVLINNKAAVCLTLALSSEGKQKIWCERLNMTPDSLLILAEIFTKQALQCYQKWEENFGGLAEDQLREQVKQTFFEDWDVADQTDRDKYLKSRVNEIKEAQIENNRRMSVCHTNMGVIYRMHANYEKAADQYLKALKLWDRNLTAENNLNQLLGKPLIKRNVIQKMFPPDKIK